MFCNDDITRTLLCSVCMSRTCYEYFVASNISADRRRHMHGDIRKCILSLQVHDKNLKCATITVAFTKPTDYWGKACDNMKTIGKHRMLWVIRAQEHSKMYENGTLRKPW